ncbi:MAG: HAD family hydrolase [Paracoccus denitrificans]|uniref:HAD family hydrolase n=1 Tax=Paracoccus denitrificans TaxID=266 RepID=A0A533I7A1_PARDE|nr:MAG: HAD family hydrolase [Paracoccus denitrificans]
MKLVVFDVDGTLIDSQALIVGAMDAAFDSVGLPPAGRDRVLSIVGLSLDIAVERLMPDAALAQRDAAVEAYRQAFVTRRISSEAPLYPGARECLEGLSSRDDLLLAVATGKSRRGLDAMLAHHGLREHFVSLRTADGHPSKPHPEMLLAACADAGVDPGDAIMIGDTEYDMHMAQAAGTAAIGVAWGYHPAEALTQLSVPVASDFGALGKMIEEWAK